MTGAEVVLSTTDPATVAVASSDGREASLLVVQSVTVTSVPEVLPHGSWCTRDADPLSRRQQSVYRRLSCLATLPRLCYFEDHTVLAAPLLQRVFRVPDSQVLPDVERLVHSSQVGVGGR